MSVPPRSLDFASEADQDLDEIFEYTELRWGYSQALAYFQTITSVLTGLLSFPNVGRSHEHVAPGLRSISVSQHVVLYRVHKDRVLIHRVVHYRENIQDAVAQIAGDDSGDINQ